MLHKNKPSYPLLHKNRPSYPVLHKNRPNYPLLHKNRLIYPVLLLLFMLLTFSSIPATVSAAEKTYLDYTGQGDSTKEFRFRMKQYTLYEGESVYLFELYTSRFWDVMPDLKETSNNPKVVAIKDGKLRAVGTGTTTITSSYSIGSKKYSFNTKIKVIAANGSTPSNKFYYDLMNGEVKITGLNSKVKDLVIPKYIGGYQVTSIADSAFSCTSIKSVVIPADIKQLGEGVFYYCKLLETVDIKLPITNVPIDTFNGCSKLTYVSLPSTVTTIRQNTFNNCTRLEKVTGSNVEVIENEAFYECKNLKTVDFPKLKHIGELSFAYCGAVDLSASNQLETIGAYAFSSSGVVTIPDLNQLNTIGESAFEWCESLTDVGRLDNLLVIGNNAFMGCSKLKSIVLSDKLTKLGAGALQGSAITSIRIPDSLTEIEEYSLPMELIFLEYNKDITRTGDTAIFDKFELIDSALAEMQISETDSQLEIIHKVHDWMVQSITYSYDRFYQATDDLSTGDFTYAVLKSRFAICASYSDTFKTFMDRFGIECIIVISDEMNHAWNMVKLDDGYWYHVDVTWDDPGWSDEWQRGHMNYYHLVCTDEQIAKDHKGWQADGVPIANGTQYADYFDHTYYVRYQ